MKTISIYFTSRSAMRRYIASAKKSGWKAKDNGSNSAKRWQAIKGIKA